MTRSKGAADLKRLQMQRLIPAPPDRVFRAWTSPDELQKWWGPKGVRCVSADVELKEGGRYRIGNELPDGTVLWIGGEFDVIEAPHLLVYTWIVETANPTTERVSVRFEPHEIGTEVILTHELIPTTALRDQHQRGWVGCLDGLRRYMDESETPTMHP